jgi:hypothetical protein
MEVSMKNKFNKILIWALMAYFGSAKLEAYQSGDQAIPGEGLHFKGREHALVGEPGPVIFNSSSNDQHMLGTDTVSRPPVQHFLGRDTASRPPVQHMLGTDTASRPPLWINTESEPKLSDEEISHKLMNLGKEEPKAESSNFNEIKQDESKLTDEEMLESLAELFKEEPQVAEEPAFDTSLSDYFEGLSKQIEGLNNELGEILSHKQFNELAAKYPLIINNYEMKNESNENYSDDQAPDLGEIPPVEDDMHLGND